MSTPDARQNRWKELLTRAGRVALPVLILTASLIVGTLLSAQWIDASAASADDPPVHAQVDDFLHASSAAHGACTERWQG